MTVLPLRPVRRIIQSAGIDRISWEANVKLARILEDFGTEIASEAAKLATHAKRKTLMEQDIELAYQRWKDLKWRGSEMSGQDPSVKPSHIHVEPSNSAQNDLKSVPESNPQLSRCQTISKEIFEQLLPWEQKLIILSGQAHLEVVMDEEVAHD